MSDRAMRECIIWSREGHQSICGHHDTITQAAVVVFLCVVIF